MTARDHLKASGWGLFRMPGERARLERIESEARQVFDIAKRAGRASSGSRGRPDAPESDDDDESRGDDGDESRGPVAGIGRTRSDAAEGPSDTLGDRYLAYLPSNRPVRGDDVLELQRQLRKLGYGNNLELDGIFGVETNLALVDFQATYGIRDDGVCGRVSILVLDYLRRHNIDAENPATQADLERIKWSASEQQQGLIVVDPVYLDDGEQSAEQNDILTVARDLLEKAIDKQIDYQTLHPQGKPMNGEPAVSAVERSSFANGMRAVLMISLSLEYKPDGIVGVATFCSTLDHPFANASKDLASYIQEEMVSATGALDRGVFEEDTELFSNTSAPSVRVMLGNVGIPSEMSRFAPGSGYLDSLAHAIATGVQRLKFLGATQAPLAARRR